MPLSENEQRILHQIEKDFYDNDPEFAREVGQTTLYRHALRNIKWAVLGGVVGLVALVAALQVHYLLAFAAFVGIFVCTVVFERNLRKMGRAGFQTMTRSMRAGQVKDAMGGFRQRMKRNGTDDAA